MTYRCTAVAALRDEVRALAAKIPSPGPSVEWAAGDLFQCKLEDVPHEHHVAFLRTGSRVFPDSDVFLCWCDASSIQWLEDLDCCLGKPDPMASGCTIFKDHPGRCDWAYIDPQVVAVQAMADQLCEELGLSHLFRQGKPSDP